MKITPSNSSEVFDIYTDVMQKYLKKQAAGSLMGEAAGATAEGVGKVVKEVAPDVLKGGVKIVDAASLSRAFRESSGHTFSVIYKDLNRIDNVIYANGPELANPAWIKASKVTLAKHQDALRKFFMTVNLDQLLAKNPALARDQTFMKAVAGLKTWYKKSIPDLIKDLDSAAAATAKGTAKETAETAAGAAAKGAGEAAEEAAPAAAKGVAEEAAPAAAKGVAEEAAPAAGKAAEDTAETIGKAHADEAVATITKTTGVSPDPKVSWQIREIGELSAGAGIMEAQLQLYRKVLYDVIEELKVLKTGVAAAGEEQATKVARLEAGQTALQEMIDSLKVTIRNSSKEVTEKSAKVVKEHTDKVTRTRHLDEAGKKKVSKGSKKVVDDAAKKSKDAGKDAGSKKVSKSHLPDSLMSAILRGQTWKYVSAYMGAKAAKTLGTLAILAAIGFGGVALWDYMFDSDEELREEYVDSIRDLQRAIVNAASAHKALQFHPDTHGELQNNDLIDELYRSRTLSRDLSNVSDPKSVMAGGEQLDRLEEELNEFSLGRNAILGDLATDKGWEEAQEADQVLRAAINRYKTVVIELAERGQDLDRGRVREIAGTAPIDEGAAAGLPRGGAATPGEEGRATIDVFGETIDISHKPAGFRSAVPRMVRKLLSHPVGMAFLDPHNRWGGFIRKSGNPKVDYLDSLGYLYREGVFTPTQLRRFIRHALPKHGRRRFSGWKNAVKYYRRHPVSHKTAENLLLSEQLIKESTNRFHIGMKKMADNFSNKYYDAISDLSDQYAKSYYAGLKSMHNTKAEKSKADYRDLYELHGEKGADLVQEAHPNAVVVSDAMGDGGLVENILEQKSRSEGVAKSAPTGNFRGKHANLAVIEALTKIANQADENGTFEVSELIDSTIQSILNN
nr:hypothetical protein 63 [bacterium]